MPTAPASAPAAADAVAADAPANALPQRAPVVWEILADLDRAPNHMATGATIVSLFPRLLEAFLNCIPEPWLQATLYPIYYDAIAAIKENRNESTLWHSQSKLVELLPGIASLASSVASSRATSLAPSYAFSSALEQLLARRMIPRAAKKGAAEDLSAAAAEIPLAKRRKAAPAADIGRRARVEDLPSEDLSPPLRTWASRQNASRPQTPVLSSELAGLGAI
ncbi:hypothetical protein CSUB01_12198 [Colletotrichum sublineola]|uniref:Uncharacterized protein n=1 Tax=Colletotrichum sublineola TaxID=1173701 RepID=A0A066XWT1_COLSU|nr:hypothetical protein CSUB01_12198 [Colletotrichum sublineola]